MGSLPIPRQLVEKEPLRSDRILLINPPPSVGHNGGIDRGYDAAPSARAPPQLFLRIPT